MLSNPWNAIILERASRHLGLGDWWLTSGCLAQTVWNRVASREPEGGILDYDLIYFDPDTSWEGEDEVIRRTATLFSDLPITVQIRNQARVPLWYEAKFGIPYPPVAAASDGIDRFPCRNTAIGVRREADDYIIHAPFGLDLTFSDTLVPNPALWVPHVYEAKARRWMTVWPHLTALPWPAPPEIRSSRG